LHGANLPVVFVTKNDSIYTKRRRAMFDSLTWRRQMYERHLLGLDDDELDDRSDISGI